MDALTDSLLLGQCTDLCGRIGANRQQADERRTRLGLCPGNFKIQNLHLTILGTQRLCGISQVKSNKQGEHKELHTLDVLLGLRYGAIGAPGTNEQ